MPAVTGGDQDGIHVRPLRQQLAHVAIHSAILIAVFAIDGVFGRFPPVLHHITDGDPLHIRLTQHPTQIVRPPPAHADATHHDAFARRDFPPATQRRGRDERGQRHRAGGHRPSCQKLAPR